jgi:hypothetical protein
VDVRSLAQFPCTNLRVLRIERAAPDLNISLTVPLLSNSIDGRAGEVHDSAEVVAELYGLPGTRNRWAAVVLGPAIASALEFSTPEPSYRKPRETFRRRVVYSLANREGGRK